MYTSRRVRKDVDAVLIIMRRMRRSRSFLCFYRITAAALNLVGRCRLIEPQRPTVAYAQHFVGLGANCIVIMDLLPMDGGSHLSRASPLEV